MKTKSAPRAKWAATARESPIGPTPAGFEDNVFHFTRVIFQTDTRRAGAGPDPVARLGVDYPDADLNFSYRLQQVPPSRRPGRSCYKLTDPGLAN